MKKIIFSLLFVMMLLGIAGCVKKVDKVSQKIIDDIYSIGEVTIEDAEIIANLTEVYSTLTDKQKEQVSNYVKLLEAKEQLEELLNEKYEKTEKQLEEQIKEYSTELEDYTQTQNYIEDEAKEQLKMSDEVLFEEE